MHGGIPRGGIRRAGGGIRRAEVSCGKVYIKRAEVSDARRGIPRGRYPAREVSDARRYPAGEVSDARRYQMRGAEGAYGGGAGTEDSYR